MNKKEIFVEQNCTKFLLKLGIPANLQGFRYLRKAIINVVEDQTLLSAITKRLYPGVAKSFNVTPSVVERSIRHCIEVATDRKGMAGLNDIFGVSIYSDNYKPANSEVIALISEKIVMLINELDFHSEN